MFTLHQSNRLTTLADRFATLTNTQPLTHPFQAEELIIPHQSMAQWLSLHIAKTSGIAANYHFQSADAFSWRMLRLTLPLLHEHTPYSRGRLVWLLFHLLGDAATDYPELTQWLSDKTEQHRFQLAQQLEHVLLRYLQYRPDWIERWENGADDHWQARLWRHLAAIIQRPHGQALYRDALQQLDTVTPILQKRFPERLSLFAVSALAQNDLDLLKALSQYSDVHVFVVNPCYEYWSGVSFELLAQQQHTSVSPELNIPQPLLASMGRQGRDFLDALLLRQPDHIDNGFVEIKAESRLSALQYDVLHLLNRTYSEANSHRSTPDFTHDDGSIQCHSCHTAMREVQVLHDSLLALFEAKPHLKASDIIVMTPNIEQYAPYIHAVFSTADEKLPYSLADQSLSTQNDFAEIMLLILELPESRYEVNRILTLLDYEPIQRRFQLSEDDVEQLQTWLEHTRIRWGIDAFMRSQQDLPADQEHSWRAGLERLLLGYVLNQEHLFGDVLPYVDIEGQLAQRLGYLVDLMETLFSLHAWLTQQHTLDDWLQHISTVLEQLLPNENQDQQQLQPLYRALDTLKQHSKSLELTHTENTLSFPLLHRLLQQSLANTPAHERFLRGAISFSNVPPMRSIPFKVIALIGMNDGAWPPTALQQSFDLLRNDYRHGDYSARQEARYLFLETLLAAEETLYISYVGQDVRANTPLPPSVLVSELLDYMSQAFGVSRAHLVTQHPLQAFSVRYRQEANDTLLTYRDYPQKQAGVTHDQVPFIKDCLAPTKTETLPLHLLQLEQFFKHPVRYFLRTRMGIDLFEQNSELSEREPFVVEGFDNHTIREHILQQKTLEHIRAEGLLPHGVLGEQCYSDESEVIALLQQVKAHYVYQPSLSISFQLGEHTVTGVLEHVTEDGLVDIMTHQPFAYQYFNFWLRHLLLCMSDQQTVPRFSYLYSPENVLTLPPLNAEDLQRFWADMIEAWIQGQNKPIQIMPKVSMAYAQAKRDPLKKAYTAWMGDPYHPGESAKEEYQLAFRGMDNPLDQHFVDWAKKLWVPLFKALQEEALTIKLAGFKHA